MLKFWNIQAILLFPGEWPLVHGGSRDKVQSQSMGRLGVQALSAYFGIEIIA